MNIKKYFITGLVILLPLTLTLLIIAFIFNLLTGPFLGMVETIFVNNGFFNQGLLFLSAQDVQNLVAKTLILVCLFLFVVGLGILGRWFLFNALIDYTEHLLKKIPLVRSIYKVCRDVIHTLFTSKNNSFKQVVLTKFPHSGAYTLGFVTCDELVGFEKYLPSKCVAVFIPTTPNPTSGFLMMFEREELIYLDMKVEEAFKYVISCGMIAPEFHIQFNESSK